MTAKVYPVIHYLNDQTTIDEAILAKSLGADGVFLISHIGSNDRLAPLGAKIKVHYPEFKVGLNLLGQSILEAANNVREYDLDMVWGDNCGVSSLGLDEQGIQLKEWKKSHSNIDMFASVAFKYQKTDFNPPLAAQEALNAGFIPTTSGAGTGKAPSLQKITSMSKAVNGQLAVASGMTCDNIQEFAPHLSHILVSTGVSKDDYHFDIDKLSRFIALIKN